MTHEGDMRRALELAERGIGRVSPNPMVGAVIVRGGEVVGEGWYTGPRGSPHAEIRALDEASERARGATMVCTLEPCSHHGATPPCAEALILAGVARVVVASVDPNPVVHGRGIAWMRAAGIDVEVGLLDELERRMNAAFVSHVSTGRPFVVLKFASSLDGKVAASDGSARWITGEPAREDAHRLRAWADAVIVGAGTAVADDPALTVRASGLEGANPPLRVLVDSGGRVPAERRIFDRAAPTLVATTDRASAQCLKGWEGAGAEVLVLDHDVAGGVDVIGLLAALGKRDVQGVLIEGGPTLAWSFVRDGSIDRVVAYFAPKLVGGAGAPSALMGGGFAPIDRAGTLDLWSVTQIGDDIRVEADVHRDR